MGREGGLLGQGGLEVKRRDVYMESQPGSCMGLPSLQWEGTEYEGDVKQGSGLVRRCSGSHSGSYLVVVGFAQAVGGQAGRNEWGEGCRDGEKRRSLRALRWVLPPPCLYSGGGVRVGGSLLIQARMEQAVGGGCEMNAFHYVFILERAL